MRDGLLVLIERAAPKWVRVVRKGDVLHVVANIILPSGESAGSASLIVREKTGEIRVEEAKPFRWPRSCPERHVNSDGTFCLGSGSCNSPTNSDEANQWWELLQSFLEAQVFATNMRKWPYVRSLHHGDAQIYQRGMEDLAAGTKFESDVRDALEYRTGWLASDLPRLAKLSNSLVNLRMPCPRKCQKKGRYILRRKCRNKNIIYELIKLETLRRQMEEAFWSGYKDKGRRCCETMDNCQLRSLSEESSNE